MFYLKISQSDSAAYQHRILQAVGASRSALSVDPVAVGVDYGVNDVSLIKD